MVLTIGIFGIVTALLETIKVLYSGLIQCSHKSPQIFLVQAVIGSEMLIKKAFSHK